MRKALQYSLNIPAIRALERVGSERVADTAEAHGHPVHGRPRGVPAGRAWPGRSGTVEVRPLDLTSAYGDHRQRRRPRPAADDPRDPRRRRHGRLEGAASPRASAPISAQAAFLVTDILAGNTDPAQNDIWAEKLAAAQQAGRVAAGRRRPRPGTTNDARDLGTYGFLPDPGERRRRARRRRLDGQQRPFLPAVRQAGHLADRGGPALARLHARLHARTGRSRSSSRPKDVVSATIDAWSGGRPGGWTRDTAKEWFIAGTQPGARKAIDADGLLYRRRVRRLAGRPGQGRARAATPGRPTWPTGCAGLGAGSGSPASTTRATAYFWGESSWGGPLYGACARPRPPPDEKDKDDDKDKDGGEDDRTRAG